MRTNKRATAIIIKDNKVLLIHRYRVERGEYYVFPGGGVESDESEEEAVVREMKEELDIQITDCDELFNFSYKRIFSPHGDKHEYYFLIRDFIGEPHWVEGNEGPKENENNTYRLEWHDLDELNKIYLLPVEIHGRIGEIKARL